MAWLTSEQALAILGTKPQSLYASVSRGRIHTRPDPDDSRRSLYNRDDVERLAGRGAGRRKATTVAAQAIHWGAPVLPSAITTITGGRLYYRGHDVVILAETATLETIAALLWESPAVSFATGPAMPAFGDPTPLQHGFAVIARQAADASSTIGRPLADLQSEATGLVATLAIAFGAAPGDAPLHRRLASAWRRPEAAHLLRKALVLLADHELNASTFAARVAASTGAPLAGAVVAGLAALTGPLHGGAAAAVMNLAAALRSNGVGALSRAASLPGFGHQLYPAGDPRAAALLESFPLPPAYAALAAVGRDLTGEPLNVDFALAALTAAYDLPPDAPLLLFALARSVGWLAHAMEQIQAGAPIRPRASYVGAAPIGQ